MQVVKAKNVLSDSNSHLHEGIFYYGADEDLNNKKVSTCGEFKLNRLNLEYPTMKEAEKFVLEHMDYDLLAEI